MAPTSSIRVSGSWKKLANSYIRVAGVWKKIDKTYVRQGGVWKLVSRSVTPGSITYSTAATHQFSVPAHNSLVVELWGPGAGGGGGDLNTTNQFTLVHSASAGPTRWDGGSASGKPQANGGSGSSTTTGGTAVNGDTNTQGGKGVLAASGGRGGDAPNGGAGGAGGSGEWGMVTAPGEPGNAPGGGGGGGRRLASPSGGGHGGGAGGYCKKTYAPGAYAVGQVVPVVVGPGSAGANGPAAKGGLGAPGGAKISWS